jgi:transcriptional antiterminator NusG
LPGQRPSQSAHPLFPGYLFARIVPDSDDLLRIRSAPGVAYLLPRAGAPTLLPEGFIDAIRSHEQQAVDSNGRARDFRRGDPVRVVSGPFKWIEGLFDQSLSASGRVRILLSLVHGSVAVQLEASELELSSAKGFRNESEAQRSRSSSRSRATAAMRLANA